MEDTVLHTQEEVAVENETVSSGSPPKKKQKTTEQQITSDSSTSLSATDSKTNTTSLTQGTFKQNNLIKENDFVILYMSDQELQWIIVRKGTRLQCRFGTFLHDSLVGVPFGSKIHSVESSRPKEKGRKSGGYVYALRPNPLLWSKTVKHRTQILYHADNSLICEKMELKPGSKVIESGTGSGSLSHFLARCIIPNGHLFTYEFHEQRFLEATQEFESHGFIIGKDITTTWRDVITHGFELSNYPNFQVDAVFLDLPKPWVCIDHTLKVLKQSGGILCCFSPCIEQVLQNCEAIRKSNQFLEPETYECLSKDYYFRTDYRVNTSYKLFNLAEESEKDKNEKIRVDSVKAVEQIRGHTGYLTFARRINIPQLQ